MNYFELIVNLHKNNKRQGPGSEAETLKALGMTGLEGTSDLKIADIGCGTGAQTITLAKNLDAGIKAVDIFPEFLNELKNEANKAGVAHKISIMEESMDALPLKSESLDLIWSEGAIYNMGFKNGVQQWRNYLKPKGYLAVSEITWTTSKPSKEIVTYWQNAYPEMATAAEKIKIIEQNGYTLCGYFYLKPESWLDNYYIPLQKGFANFLTRNGDSTQAKAVVEEYKNEIVLYNKYKKQYSYGFYIAQKC